MKTTDISSSTPRIHGSGRGGADNHLVFSSSGVVDCAGRESACWPVYSVFFWGWFADSKVRIFSIRYSDLSYFNLPRTASNANKVAPQSRQPRCSCIARFFRCVHTNRRRRFAWVSDLVTLYILDDGALSLMRQAHK